MECLWTAWNGFQCELSGFPQPFVCVWAGRASHGRLRDGRALLALIDRIYTMGILSGILLAFCTLKFCKGRNTAANNSTSLELTVEDEAGDVIYWTITRQMYHIREK